MLVSVRVLNMKERKKFFAELEALGYSIEMGRSSHYKVRWPSGGYLMTMAASPSDPNALKAAKKLFRKLTGQEIK